MLKKIPGLLVKMSKGKLSKGKRCVVNILYPIKTILKFFYKI